MFDKKNHIEHYLEILKNNGIRISNDSNWNEEIVDKVYSSNSLERLHIYPDRLVYWEDIRCSRSKEIINLPPSKDNLWKF